MATPTTMTSDDGNATVSAFVVQDASGAYMLEITGLTPNQASFGIKIQGQLVWQGQARLDDQG